MRGGTLYGFLMAAVARGGTLHRLLMGMLPRVSVSVSVRLVLALPFGEHRGNGPVPDGSLQ